MSLRRKNKKKSMLLVLLMLIAGISMGYAILNTTLNINGTSKIKDAKWNIYWDNPQVTTGSVTTTAPIIDSLKTTATFDITLNKPKDYYEFTIDAVNAGTIDAMIKVNGVNNKVYSDSTRTTEITLPDAIKYTVTYADGTEILEKHLLAKKSGNTPTRETYKVRVEYRNDEETTAADLEEITEETIYYMSFSVEYVQAENAVERSQSAITYINRQVAGQITPGDIIGIGETEDFYVVSSTPEKTVLLAKYNLLVGHSVEYDGYVPTDIPGYGLQSIDARGYFEGTSYCTEDFSTTNYWMNGNNLTSSYNKNDTIYLDSSSQNYWDHSFKYRSDDSDVYPYVYDSNSKIYQYISGQGGYVDKLKAMGAPSTITGRLLTYEEADTVKEVGRVDIDEDRYTSVTFNGQTYWLGSAINDYEIGNVNSYQYIYFMYHNSSSSPDAGIRPVIEIPTSELQ